MRCKVGLFFVAAATVLMATSSTYGGMWRKKKNIPKEEELREIEVEKGRVYLYIDEFKIIRDSEKNEARIIVRSGHVTGSEKTGKNCFVPVDIIIKMTRSFANVCMEQNLRGGFLSDTHTKGGWLMRSTHIAKVIDSWVENRERYKLVQTRPIGELREEEVKQNRKLWAVVVEFKDEILSRLPVRNEMSRKFNLTKDRGEVGIVELIEIFQPKKLMTLSLQKPISKTLASEPLHGSN